MNERRWLVAAAPGALVSILGLAAVVTGLALFGRGFLTPSADFFANPEATMDQTARDGFLGVVLFAGGSFAVVAGLGMSLFGSALGLFTQVVRGRTVLASTGFVPRRCSFCQSSLPAMAKRCPDCNAPQR
ncbi:MAG: hypothetical protein ABTQ32_37000 [Myxococcaceae bacterium]